MFGAWACEPTQLCAMVELVRACDIQAVSAATMAVPARAPYVLHDGIAHMEISGPITKYETSFSSLTGGTSSLGMRNSLRAAVRDPQAKAIFVRVDSPGGTVSGTGDLADAIAAADKVKPVYAFVEDTAASAAYWAVSGARHIYANPSALVGAIGTFAVLTDTSGAADKAGVKVHVVSAGKFKGMGTPGTPITDEHLEEAQARVDAFNELFLSGVSTGRKIPIARVRELADGRLHIAQAAKDLGLIDSIASIETATREIARKTMDADQLAAKAAEDAQARAEAETKLAELQAQMSTMASQVKAANDALAQVAHEKAVAAVQAKLSALKSLPAQAGLAEALVSIQNAAPEAFAVLETHLSAWNSQNRTAGLFQEIGSSASGSNPTLVLDTNPISQADADKWRKEADALVAAGKYKTRAAAMVALTAKGGN